MLTDSIISITIYRWKQDSETKYTLTDNVATPQMLQADRKTDFPLIVWDSSKDSICYLWLLSIWIVYREVQKGIEKVVRDEWFKM